VLAHLEWRLFYGTDFRARTTQITHKSMKSATGGQALAGAAFNRLLQVVLPPVQLLFLWHRIRNRPGLHEVIDASCGWKGSKAKT
jgi:hypothetical protein